MGDLEKEMFDKVKQLDEYFNRKEVVKLAKVLVDIDQLILKVKEQFKDDSITMDESAKLNLQVSMLKTQIEDVVTNMCKDDLNLLFDVSHELIKLEAKTDDMVVDRLLSGQVKPDILRQLICSNFFNQKIGIVEPKTNMHFRLTTGVNNNLL